MSRSPLAARTGVSTEVLRDLERQVGPSITSSLTWLDTWVRTHPATGILPATVVGPDGGLDGWFAFEVRGRGVLDVHAVGHEVVDRLDVWAVDRATEIVLAERAAEALLRLPPPWRLVVDQLPEGSAFGRGLARAVGGELGDGDGCPVTDVADRVYTDLYGSWRKQVRQAGNRIERDGHEHHVEVVTDPMALAELLPVLERIHVARDRDLDRRSDLELDGRRAFWRDVVLRLAAEDRVRCFLLHVDDDLVAYDIALVDGDVLRNWDGRFAPRAGDWWPGKLMLGAVARHACDEPRYRRLDQMRGAHRHKTRIADRVDPHVTLRAWSGPMVRAWDGARSRGRARLDRLREEHDAVDEVARRVKRQLVL